MPDLMHHYIILQVIRMINMMEINLLGLILTKVYHYQNYALGAFYGRTWKVSLKTNGGYNQKGDGTIKGSSSDEKENGKYSST